MRVDTIIYLTYPKTEREEALEKIQCLHAQGFRQLTDVYHETEEYVTSMIRENHPTMEIKEDKE